MTAAAKLPKGESPMNKRLLERLSLVLLLGTVGVAPARALAPLPGPDPAFSSPAGTALLTSVGGSMAVAGDFNLDGVMDLAVTNPTAGTVTILLGPGFATPAPGSPQILFAVGTSTLSQPVYLAVADFDANGSPDLVVVSRQASSATVFKNNLTASGTVSFTRTVFPVPPFSVGVMPVQVAVGDVNGDGKLDFVTANYLGNSVAVFFGDGSGTSFSAFPQKSYAVSGAPSGSNPNSVVISDLNRDGKLDLVVGANNGSQVFTFINGGSASDPFAAGSTAYTIGANPVAAAVADFNGDLNPDVVVSNNGGVGGVPVVSVLFGDGSGALGTAPCASGCGPGTRLDIPGVGLSPQGVVAGDVNGDGYPDITVVDDAHGASDGVKIFLGNGLGCFGNTAPVGSPCGTWSPTALIAGGGPAGVGLADVTGDGKPDLFVANQQAPGLTLYTTTLAGAVACASTQPHPAACIISPVTPCIGIDVSLSGVTPGGSAVRGYSLTLKLSSGLAPCAAPTGTGPLPASALVTTNGFLQGASGQRATVSRIYQNPDGTYTIDETILNPPTPGPASCTTNTSGSGRLFTIYLGKSAIAATSGTVSVTGLVLRDCNNNPLTAFRCPSGSALPITILPTAPAAPSGLTVRQHPMPNSNPPGSFFALEVSWTNPAPDPTLASSTYDIWRAPFGGINPSSGYPDYSGTFPVMPTRSLLYPTSGGTGPWVKVASVPTSQSSFEDGRTSFPASNPRGFWYYAIARIDPCGVCVAVLDYSSANVLSGDGGTLNYYLGDIANGLTTVPPCAGDNIVDRIDDEAALLPLICDCLLGPPPTDPAGCVDYAPTRQLPATDGSGQVYPQLGRPVPDRRINGEEVFILSFSKGSNRPQLSALPVAADHDEVTLTSPAHVAAGSTFTVELRIKGAGDMHGIIAQLAWDHGTAEPVSVETSALGNSQDADVVMPMPGYVVATVPGYDHVGLLGDDVLATVTFRAKATADPAVTIATLDARDREMRKVLDGRGGGIVPAVNAFGTVTPNPFQRNVTLGFSLAREGRAELAVYSVEGRRIKALASGVRSAGQYRFEWDGSDEAGRSVVPGVYFVRLMTQEGRFSHTLVRIR
jgi:hypothetical protein